MSISQTFSEQCRLVEKARADQQKAVTRWVIALSGGLDSIVTLHLASQLLPPDSLVAIHVNHQQQAQADQWQSFCQRICAVFNIPLQTFVLSPLGSSEQVLRDARYQCFTNFLRENDCLLMGHHANDQAETLLFRLVRGAGAKGLSGIPRSRAIAAGFLLRPLLSIPRSQLQSYAQQHQLDWVDDPSNLSVEYDRNYIRHRVLAPLAEHWPKASSKMAHSAQLISEDQQLLEEYLNRDLELMLDNGRFDLVRWQGLSSLKKRALLRFWLQMVTDVSLSTKQLTQIIDQLIYSRQDASAHYLLAHFVLRRYREQLYLIDSRLVIQAWPKVQGTTAEFLLSHGRLSITSAQSGIDINESMRLQTLSVARKVKPVNRPSKSLKKLFQEHAVAPWLREQWPVLMAGDEIVAVVGICICEGWLRKDQNKSYFRLDWQPL